jgi:hypothetical protein
MTDKNTFAEGVSYHADDSRRVHWTPERHHWTDVMKHFRPR